MAAPPAPDEIGASDTARRIIVSVAIALLVATAAGMVLLWPDRVHHRATSEAIAPDDSFRAVVTKVERAPCDGGESGVAATCTTAQVRLREGPDDGEVVQLPQESDATVRLDVGDDIVVSHYADAEPRLQYAYADRERRQPLAGLVVVFALLAVVLGRWRGLGALAAVAAAIVVLTVFLLPALVDGQDPLLVTLVAGSAIAALTTYLRRGINVGSTIAVVSSLASLAIVAAVAWATVRVALVTGSTAEVDVLDLVGSSSRLRGLMIAGIAIGTIGVLCDVVMRQVSAVWAVRGTEPPASRTAVFRIAMRSGWENVASSTTMLVLAYLGAVLPVLLVLTQTGQGLSDAGNSEVIAVEVVRALAGAIGVAMSVPITTLLATWVIGTTRPERRRDDPRAYRNRHERALWAGAAAAPPAMPDRPDRAL